MKNHIPHVTTFCEFSLILKLWPLLKFQPIADLCRLHPVCLWNPSDVRSLGPIVFVGFFVGSFVGSLVGFIWYPWDLRWSPCDSWHACGACGSWLAWLLGFQFGFQLGMFINTKSKNRVPCSSPSPNNDKSVWMLGKKFFNPTRRRETWFGVGGDVSS